MNTYMVHKPLCRQIMNIGSITSSQVKRRVFSPLPMLYTSTTGPEGNEVPLYHSPYVKYGDGLKHFKYYVYRGVIADHMTITQIYIKPGSIYIYRIPALC